MIRAILFDLDGVVADSEPLYEIVERELLGQYGISISAEDQKDFKGSTESQFYDLMEKKYRPQWNRQEAVNEGRKRLKELFVSELEFVPGFGSLMERLGDRYLTGLVTSTPRSLFEVVRESLSLGRFFKEVICADDISDGKPHPEPYETMMGLLSVSPEETLVIEDSLHGIASAKASGALCVALVGSFPRSDLQGADAVIDSLDQMNDLLIKDLSLMNKKTPELILKPIDETDLEFWESVVNEPAAREHQPIRARDEQELREELVYYSERKLSHPTHRKYKWTVTRKGTGQKVGFISFDKLDLQHRIGRIGYTLSQRFWGHGIGTAAVGEAVRKIFTESDTERIEAECSIHNHASSRVLEKNGFGLEGIKRGHLIIDGERVDHFSYGLLREDWTERD